MGHVAPDTSGGGRAHAPGVSPTGDFRAGIRAGAVSGLLGAAGFRTLGG